MKYDELSAEQKDELVHEKVMSQSVICDGPYRQLGRSMSFPYQTTIECTKCLHQTWKGHEKPHKVHVPYYTESMDAAWQVIQEMNKPIDGSYARYAAFCDALERIIGSNLLFDILYCDALGCHLTADRICRAALYALGVIDESGEVVEVQS